MSTSLELLNVIRGSLGTDYQSRVPEATRENIKSVGNTILDYTPHANMFLTALMNRIGRVVIDKMESIDDIYSIFGEERLEFGDTIQKIFIDIPNMHNFEGTATQNPASMLSIEKGTIHVEFTSVDRRVFYKTTISIPEIKEAFITAEKLDAFVTALVESLATAWSLDKYIMLTNTLAEHCKYATSASGNGVNRILKVPSSVARYNTTTKEVEWDSVGAKNFLKLLRIASRSLKFAHKLDYGEIDDETFLFEKKGQIKAVRTPVNNQVVALEVSTMATIDVDALATLFNLSKGEYETRMLELEDGALGENVLAEYYQLGFICDKDAVIRGTSFEDKDSFKNPEHEYVNFWSHYWGYMAVSKFKDFVPIVVETYEPQE